MKNKEFIKSISYNAHYVKWNVNWWKIPVFKIANKRFYVKSVDNFDKNYRITNFHLRSP